MLYGGILIYKFTITVIGLGFVGLTSALAFADKSNKVYGFDVDEKKVNLIKKGELPFLEPGLDQALSRHLGHNFFVENNLEIAVNESDFIFLCVGTPSDETGEADLTYIYSSLDNIKTSINDDKYRVIVIKSTIPPSTTTEKIIPYIINKGFDLSRSLGVANNPEFLREGHCWDDIIAPDRIVCGVSDSRTEALLKQLYIDFNAPIFSVSLNTAEYIKYLSNSFLATMISFSNEMSKIADAIGDIEIKKSFEILHLDKRWGGASMSSYVYPGVGYGGYCLPKDTQAMYETSRLKGYESEILKNVIRINNSMPKFMVEKIKKTAKDTNKIGILGLSFKPGSDDVRESPAAKIIKILLEEGYNNINAYDPCANDKFSIEYNFHNIHYFESLDGICESSDILVLVTSWNEFYGIDKKYSSKTIVDCRYFL